MSSDSAPRPNPYVGPRPFQREDGALFFGRASELQQLTSLLVATRLVILHAPSGAGKTSLISASLLEEMERQGFTVPTLVRFGDRTNQPVGGDANPFVGALLESLGGTRLSGQEATLAAALGDVGEGAGDDDPEYPAPRLVVLDQFEEVFAAYPEAWSARHDFFGELARALVANPLVRILIAVREEHLAELQSHLAQAELPPTAQFRLERLQQDSALAAVREPARAFGAAYPPGAAENLVRNLSRIRVRRGGRVIEAEGEFVEPLHLQVVCHRLWETSRTPDQVISVDAVG